MNEMYTVKQLSELAEVSVRTLHHYDAIGLLKPSSVGTNAYRYYDDAALLRLQQILFYRELGMELMQIKDVLDNPDFDVMEALRAHRAALQKRIGRLGHLIGTIDQTMKHLAGEVRMSKKQMFTAFSKEKQADYERRARLQYGPHTVNESIRRWNDYTEAQRQAILREGGEIYSALAEAIDAQKAATSGEVQALIARWHEHMRAFYEPTLEILRGLGELYATDPEFGETFAKFHTKLAEYLREAIDMYVDGLETAEIARLLAEDDSAAGTAQEPEA